MAQDAETRGDWAEAKRCWYYAAQQTSDGDMRSYYNKREDAAGEQIMDNITDLNNERHKRRVLGTPEQRARRATMERDVIETVLRHIEGCTCFAIIEALALAIVRVRNVRDSGVTSQDVAKLLELFEELESRPSA